MTISDEDKLKCLLRELALRRNAYPKWVAGGRMKEATADREIAILAAIVEDYRQRVNSMHDYYLDKRTNDGGLR